MDTPDYIAITFNNVNDAQTEMLIALLNSYGFAGFEEDGKRLKAYIIARNFDEEAFAESMSSLKHSYDVNTIPSQNWNAVWEEQFEPVIVNDFVGIRAHFHPAFTNKVAHEVVITPKMSFGTGHHATTWMMMEQMQHLDFKNNQVLDFGTGTGILAILSEKLGAARILAIDIEEWSIENAKENIARNDCHRISLQQADKVITGTRYNIILANINRNIILQNVQQLYDCLAAEGYLLISGLLAEDEAVILSATHLVGLKHCSTVRKQQWIAMLFAR